MQQNIIKALEFASDTDTMEDEQIELIKMYATKILDEVQSQKGKYRSEPRIRQQPKPNKKSVTIDDSPQEFMIYEDPIIQDKVGEDMGQEKYPKKPQKIIAYQKNNLKNNKVKSPFISSKAFERAMNAARRQKFIFYQTQKMKTQQVQQQNLKPFYITKSRSNSKQKRKSISSFLNRVQTDIKKRKQKTLKLIVQKLQQNNPQFSKSRSITPSKKSPSPSKRIEKSKRQKQLWQLRKQKRLQQQKQQLKYSLTSNIHKVQNKMMKKFVIPGSVLKQAFEQ